MCSLALIKDVGPIWVWPRFMHGAPLLVRGLVAQRSTHGVRQGPKVSRRFLQGLCSGVERSSDRQTHHRSIDYSVGGVPKNFVRQ